jgi:predicted transcriptional regulator
MKKDKSKLELKGLVKKYLSLGLSQVEIAELLNMTRQAVHYWVRMIRRENG